MRYVIAITMLLVLLTLGAANLNTAVQRRADVAQSWSTDDVQTYASGTLNFTLSITLSDPDPIACDVAVGEILQDVNAVRTLKSNGFTHLQCGRLTEDIQ
jgi:Tfp pilus assembly pilus retraction ATPase PilT